MSRYHDRGGDAFPDPARTFEEVQAPTVIVALDGCNSAPGTSKIVAYLWNVNGVHERRTNCRFPWTAPAKGSFPVSLTVEAADGTTHSQTQLVVLRDLLIASIGDSLGSGQGNPHQPAVWEAGSRPVPATWEDTRCHRSATAGSAQAARIIEDGDRSTSVTFVHLACSGARISDPSPDNNKSEGGLLDPYEGQDDGLKGEPGLPPQLEALNHLVGDRRIDALMVSIGINDIGFADIIQNCIALDHCQKFEAQKVANALESLRGKYIDLSAGIKTWFPDLHPSRVFINQYPDFTRDDDGRLCRSLIAGTISFDEVVWMATVGPRLNATIRDAANDHRWTLVDQIAEAYRHNGECADDHWFRRLDESLRHQGNQYGAMHPNEKGHMPLRDRFVSFLRPAVLGAGPPQIFVNGLALQGKYPVGTAPKVLVYDPTGLQSSSLTLDGSTYTSESPITTPGAHTLVVDAINTAGVRSTLTIPFSLEALEVSSLTVAPSSVVGGKDAVASVQLNHPAPVGGMTVTLASSNPALASVPAPSVLIPEGASAGEYVLRTVPVSQDTSVTISATTSAGTPKTAPLAVQAPRVTTIALDQPDVVGGTAATVTVHLNGPAPAGGLSLTLQTSDGVVVPATTISVPGAATSANSSVPTNAVTQATPVRLWITGHHAEATLTVFQPRVVVPIVLGEGESVATQRLRGAGLTWELRGEHGRQNSKVLEQNPAGGVTVDFGEKVILTMTINDKL